MADVFSFGVVQRTGSSEEIGLWMLQRLYKQGCSSENNL